MRLAGEEPTAVEPFWDSVASQGLGDDYAAFGYPEDVAADTPGPTPRLFTGHFQRFFDHSSYAGYNYRAGEMSLPAPAGLSGGPVFRRQAPVMVMGLVAENFESSTTLHAVEEITEEGRERRTGPTG